MQAFLARERAVGLREDSVGLPCIRSDVDIFAVASALQDRGWVPNAFHNPDCIHVRLTPAHEAVIKEFVEDIRLSVADARAGKKADGLTGVYATQ